MIMEKSAILTQITAAITATLSAMCAGFLLGSMSPLLVQLQANGSTLALTPNQGSWIASIVYPGVIPGTFIAGAMTNRWGRKLPLLSVAIPYAISFILIGLAQNYWWLIISRFLTGMAYGASYTFLPIYLGEIADDTIRGTLGVIMNQMSNFGILLVYCIGPWVDYTVLAGIGLAIPVIFCLTFCWMPESPYYLVMKKRHKDAEKSLVWLRGKRINIAKELKKIEETIKIDMSENSGTVKDLLMSPGNRKALVIVTILVLASQLSGISVIMAYTGLIFQASKSNLSSNVSLIIIGVIQFLSGMLSMFTIDLLGRRPLLLFSTCGSAVFLTGEALYFQLQANGTDISGISWLPITGIIGYILCSSVALGPMPTVLVSELFPCNLKAKAIIYCGILIALSGMAVTKLYQVIADAYGIHSSFWVFVVCTVSSTVLIYFLLPETRQKSFREIQDQLRGTKKSVNADAFESTGQRAT